MKFELEDLLRSSCWFAKTKPNVLILIYFLTGKDPCAKCNMKNDCKALNDLGRHKHRPKIHGAETNAEIAERLGVTPRQVSKMRKRGEL